MQTQKLSHESLHLCILWILLSSYKHIFQEKICLQKGMLRFLHSKYFKPDMGFYACSKGVVIVIIGKERFLFQYLSG